MFLRKTDRSSTHILFNLHAVSRVLATFYFIFNEAYFPKNQFKCIADGNDQEIGTTNMSVLFAI